MLFVVGYNKRYNNNGHNCRLCTTNNNYDQRKLNKQATNQLYNKKLSGSGGGGGGGVGLGVVVAAAAFGVVNVIVL